MWPFGRRARRAYSTVPPDSLLVIEGALRASIEDMLLVKERQSNGARFRWGGQLLVDASHALPLAEERFRPYGFTPFLKHADDLTWVEAVPLAAVVANNRPTVNAVLFLLTVLSTFIAGALPFGAIPFVNFDPLREPMSVRHG